jgi:hypothetical protein
MRGDTPFDEAMDVVTFTLLKTASFHRLFSKLYDAVRVNLLSIDIDLVAALEQRRDFRMQ